MAEHTPGPWSLGMPGGPQGPFYSVVNGQGRVVALQILGEADARLIAAAPDLLEACEAALEFVDESAECYGHTSRQLRADLTKAIAKAKSA